MIIGMVQVVPRVKAAANVECTVTATYGSGGTSAQFTFKLKTDTLIYNGTPQLPEIVPNSVTCTNSSFNGTLSISGTGGIGAGSYTCGLTSSQSGWKFDDDCISYTIAKANIRSITATVKSSAHVQKYTGENVCLKAEDIEVNADINGTQTTIASSQYTVSGGQTACGNALCQIDINSSNYEGVLMKDGISYVIAYDLGGTVGYKASIDKTNIGFSESMTLPTVTLSNGEKTINVANYPLVFDVKYYKNGVQSEVDSVGDYTVEVTPYNGADYCVYEDDSVSPQYTYFTGKRSLA